MLRSIVLLIIHCVIIAAISALIKVDANILVGWYALGIACSATTIVREKKDE